MTKFSYNELNATWHLDFSISRYIGNNNELFLDYQFQNYKFINASGEII